MSIFKRFKRVMKAKANKAISLLENEEELLEQSINEMEEEFEKMNAALIQAIASEMDAKNLMNESESKMNSYHEKGVKAFEEGKEDDAKEFFSAEYTQKIEFEEYEKMYNNIKTQNDALKDKIKELNKQKVKMSHKKDVLIAKIKVAKAQKEMQNTYSNFNTNSATGEFNKIEKKVQHMENEVKAGEIVNSELEPAVNKLDAAWEDHNRDSFVEEAIKAMKNKKK